MSFGNAGSFNVGELLRLFCSTLREQIKHRMYFYKTSTLVRYNMCTYVYIVLPPLQTFCSMCVMIP